MVDKGLKVMRDSLDAGKRVVAITADVQQFYHRTSPDFLLDGKYQNSVGLARHIEGDARRFTKALINAIHSWADHTPLHWEDPSVGLPAARLIANVALVRLWQEVLRSLDRGFTAGTLVYAAVPAWTYPAMLERLTCNRRRIRTRFFNFHSA